MGTLTKEQARAAARDLLVRFSITAPPVPVDKIAKGLGATIQHAPLDDELSGMVFIKNGQPVIGVNSLHHPNRQRFTIAHEIAHLVLHREHITSHVHVDKAFTLFRDPVAATGTDAIEIQANAFASELLMPEAWIKETFSSGIELEDEAALVAAARRFRVSKAAIQNRLIQMF